jgi:hypothetical protein
MTTFFSTIGDRRRLGTYDSNLELRAYSASAVSSTTSETGIAFAVRKQDTFRVVINAAAYTSYSAGAAEWTITVEVSDVVGGTYTAVATLDPATAAGAAIQIPIDISGGEVAAIDADAAFIRVTATKTGSPGNLTYGAYIVPA